MLVPLCPHKPAAPRSILDRRSEDLFFNEESATLHPPADWSRLCPSVPSPTSPHHRASLSSFSHCCDQAQDKRRLTGVGWGEGLFWLTVQRHSPWLQGIPGYRIRRSRCHCNQGAEPGEYCCAIHFSFVSFLCMTICIHVCEHLCVLV